MPKKSPSQAASAPPQETATPFEIPKLDLKEINVIIAGVTPLIMHRWSEKAKKQMRDKQQKAARQAKEAKNPERDFRESLYAIDEKKQSWGFATAARACPTYRQTYVCVIQ